MDSDFPWDKLSSISTAVGVLFGLIVIIVTSVQLKEMARARHLEAMLKIYEMIGSQECRADRRMLYEKLLGVTDFSSIDADLQNSIERVTTSFDRIGKLVKSKLVPPDEFLESNYEVVIRSWFIAKPYLESHANKIGGRHCSHFRYLYELACKYHNNKYPNSEIRIVTRHTTKIVNIPVVIV